MRRLLFSTTMLSLAAVSAHAQSYTPYVPAQPAYTQPYSQTPAYTPPAATYAPPAQAYVPPSETAAPTHVAPPAATAQNGLFIRPYVGGDYDYTHVHNGDNQVFPNDFNGGNVHAGLRIGRFLGLETGFGATEQKTKHNVLGSGLDDKLDYQQWTIDAMGYLPLDKKLELLGSVGGVRTNGHVSVPGFGSSDQHEWDARYGAGLQYWLDDHVNLRAMFHYTDFHDSDGGIMDTSIGVNYMF